MELTRAYLHKIEMKLVGLCEDDDTNKETIKEEVIENFTDLMSNVRM